MGRRDGAGHRRHRRTPSAHARGTLAGGLPFEANMCHFLLQVNYGQTLAIN